MSLEDVRKSLKSIFPINESYLDSSFLKEEDEEDILDDTEDTEEPSEDNESDADSTEDTEDTEEPSEDSASDADSTEDTTDSTEDTEEPPEPVGTPEDKIETLFKDSGNPSHDWNLSSEANQRLATFKFKVIGVDYESLMTEKEKAEGVPSNILEQRLTTDEMVVYRDTIADLRKKYPLISTREKNIIMWNASIPIFANDKKGDPINIYKDNNSINEAFEKIDEYLQKKYSEFWQDDKKAIDFIRNVKINFADTKSKITPHLITSKNLQEMFENDIICFNKVSCEPPETLLNFVRDNMKNEEFNKSTVFNTISSDFSEDGNISRGSVYPIIKGTVTEEENEDDGEGSVEDEGGGDFDAGGFGGGSDIGGDGPPMDGGDDFGGDGEDSDGDVGADDGADDGADGADDEEGLF